MLIGLKVAAILRQEVNIFAHLVYIQISTHKKFASKHKMVAFNKLEIKKLSRSYYNILGKIQDSPT